MTERKPMADHTLADGLSKALQANGFRDTYHQSHLGRDGLRDTVSFEGPGGITVDIDILNPSGTADALGGVFAELADILGRRKRG